MSTLIVYSSKYGSTEKCVKMLLEKIEGKVELFNLKEEKNIDVEAYDKVIIGGSVYMGSLQKEVTDFCTNKLEGLKKKKIGLFTCCMKVGEEAEAQLNTVFPQEVLTRAVAKESFGGEFIFKKMNFLEKIIIRVVAKTNQDASTISLGCIDKFAKTMNHV